MTTKNKIIILVVYTLAVGALGAYLVPTKTKIETKVVEVEKKTSKDDAKVAIKKHRTATIVTTRKPDGESTTTTTLTDDTGINSDTKSQDTVSKDTESSSSKEVTKSSGHLNISALAGANLFSAPNSATISYGLSVTRDVIGPFSLGVFGFNSGLAGASVGITF